MLSSDVNPSKDSLPSQVLGEDVVVTAIKSTTSTSPGQINLDASADSGLDIGVSQQPTDNEPDITGEPTEKFNA